MGGIHSRFPLSYLAALCEIDKRPGLSAIALADTLSMTPSAITRLLQALSSSGYGLVQIEPHKTSRREISLYLAPAAQRMIDKMNR